MDRYAQLATEFDQWANADRTSSMANGHWDVTMQMLDTLDLTGCETMIDVGCGNGWLVRELLRRGIRSGIGVDISPQMIHTAQQASSYGEREQYLVSNGEDLPLESNSVDCITNIESLYYYPAPKAALREWSRIAKPGGKLAIMMDLYEENPATHTWITALDVPVHLFSMEQIRRDLEETGWTDVQLIQHQDRRPMKTEAEFTASAYWPSYAQYVQYRKTGSLCITAVRR